MTQAHTPTLPKLEFCGLNMLDGGIYIRPDSTGEICADDPILEMSVDFDQKKQISYAKQIVRACNSHDDLVKALEDLLNAPLTYRDEPEYSSRKRFAARDFAKDIIAKAKGE